MNTGFGCVEAGFCRKKNAVNILAKNFVVFGIASLGFWALGFGLMFGDGTALIGTSGWFVAGADNSPATGDAYAGVYSSLNWAGIPLFAKFFFQLAFAATAATIVSGCVAERIHYSSFMVFAFAIAAIGYPVTGHWIWGGGWLQQLGMWDFAGSTVVHSVGGWAGLAGILLLGPRIGKYRKDGSVSPILGHSMPLAFLGGMILWLGWFGFNPGSTMGIIGDGGVSVSHIVVTTNLACAAGLIAATITAKILLGKPDFSMTVNGALAGLVAITAPCAFVTPVAAMLIGLIGGVLVVVAVRGFDRICIDDPVGALSVHLVCGIWGTLAVGLFATKAAPGGIDQNGLFYGGGLGLLGVQALGVVAVGAATFTGAYVVWSIIKATMTIRVAASVESEGLDINEMGSEAYPAEISIDVVELIRQSQLGKHVQEIFKQEARLAPRAADTPPSEIPVYMIRLSNVDPAAFISCWKDLCGAQTDVSKDFREIYKYFTTLGQDSTLRFRGGDAEFIRKRLQALATTISPNASAELTEHDMQKMSVVMQ
jgi:Amt family ammonium transporter